MAEKSVFSGGKPVPAQDLHFEYANNGSGFQATGNYAGGVEQFKVTCKTGSQKLHLTRMIIYLEDVGNFNSSVYGVNITLTNGITVVVYDADDTELQRLTCEDAVLTNAQWARLCYDASYLSWGNGNDSLTVRWTFERSGKPVSLTSGQYLAVELNDDFTGLEDHTFMLQGHYS